MQIGLALGAGAAKGWAHVGVLQALNELDVTIECIAGTSIGALIGGLFAAGTLDDFVQDMLDMDWKRIISLIDLVFPKNGLIDGKKVTHLLKKYLPANIEDLNLPFAAISTDLATGKEVVLEKGPLIEAIRASISVPAIFTPVIKDNCCLVDGGLVNPVPVNIVRTLGTQKVLAVDLNYKYPWSKPQSFPINSQPKPILPPPKRFCRKKLSLSPTSKLEKVSLSIKEKLAQIEFTLLEEIRSWMTKADNTPHIFEIIHSSLALMEVRLTEVLFKLHKPDLILRPNLDQISFLDFHKGRLGITIGYEATLNLFAANKSLLKN